MHSSEPTRFLALQRYVPDTPADAFLTLTVPPTGSAERDFCYLFSECKFLKPSSRPLIGLI